MHGILVLNKPSGPTSRSAVNEIQKLLFRRTKLGHAGTLDPLASGVLLLALGQATRLIEYLQDMPKVYRTVIRLGATSSTDDAAGEIAERAGQTPVAEADIREKLESFVGIIEQLPPAFSAIKIDGKRAHELARKNRTVELTPRPVRIDCIDFLGYQWPELELRIHCGKGTYIRSIARDLGEKLGCGGLVQVLEREAVGPFDLSDPLPVDCNFEMIQRAVMPMESAIAGMPREQISEEEIAKLYQGQFLNRLGQPDLEELALFDQKGVLQGIVSRKEGTLYPQKVFKNY
ncbi:tRNA pseudouridine(55) synthase TruB [Telmatocola sphagniphila]|uniref:tRNA pseudouridine synthase B n=1 Tax=Telmatocola sphagniphila TaxID=1123043 RepID=A0A8E6BAL7_9BACT|nr:tRNA pseudouridine(55) synthase TruB [Telmatocola sphagniphila]QVL34329.1 tRNA pseudouridine(55) synthase TruB [Telmatocola sphagniphila]